jgi:hypothetical protein
MPTMEHHVHTRGGEDAEEKRVSFIRLRAVPTSV